MPFIITPFTVLDQWGSPYTEKLWVSAPGNDEELNHWALKFFVRCVTTCSLADYDVPESMLSMNMACEYFFPTVPLKARNKSRVHCKVFHLAGERHHAHSAPFFLINDEKRRNLLTPTHGDLPSRMLMRWFLIQTPRKVEPQANNVGHSNQTLNWPGPHSRKERNLMLFAIEICFRLQVSVYSTGNPHEKERKHNHY